MPIFKKLSLTMTISPMEIMSSIILNEKTILKPLSACPHCSVELLNSHHHFSLTKDG